MKRGLLDKSERNRYDSDLEPSAPLLVVLIRRAECDPASDIRITADVTEQSSNAGKLAPADPAVIAPLRREKMLVVGPIGSEETVMDTGKTRVEPPERRPLRDRWHIAALVDTTRNQRTRLLDDRFHGSQKASVDYVHCHVPRLGRRGCRLPTRPVVPGRAIRRRLECRRGTDWPINRPAAHTTGATTPTQSQTAHSQPLILKTGDGATRPRVRIPPPPLRRGGSVVLSGWWSDPGDCLTPTRSESS